MRNLELIEKSYLEAVKGVQEEWFLYSNSNWYDYVMNLPIHLRVTYLVVILHNQVFNGGFHQYFVNGYGQFANETILVLLDVGASKRANILEVAYKIVNANNLSTEIFREQLLDKKIQSLFATDELYVPLDKLDNEYYNLVEEDIETLLSNYLKSC